MQPCIFVIYYSSLGNYGNFLCEPAARWVPVKYPAKNLYLALSTCPYALCPPSQHISTHLNISRNISPYLKYPANKFYLALSTCPCALCPLSQRAGPILISTFTTGDVNWDFACRPHFLQGDTDDTLHIIMSEPYHQSIKQVWMEQYLAFLKP